MLQRCVRGVWRMAGPVRGSQRAWRGVHAACVRLPRHAAACLHHYPRHSNSTKHGSLCSGMRRMRPRNSIMRRLLGGHRLTMCACMRACVQVASAEKRRHRAAQLSADDQALASQLAHIGESAQKKQVRACLPGCPRAKREEVAGISHRGAHLAVFVSFF